MNNSYSQKDAVLLEAHGLSAGYGKHTVLRKIDLKINRGDFIGILGPNGCGKTTLLRALTGILTPFSGRVELEGKPLPDLGAKTLARKIAVVSQSPPGGLDLGVRDIVLLGRIPHFQKWQWWANEQDQEIVSWALAATETGEIAEKNFLNLSGGEQQRVLIALALTQKPELLILDEPTLHLDINYQVEIFELLRRMHREYRLTILTVLHDLNLAAAYCRRLILLKDGGIWREGQAKDLITEKNLREVFRARMGVASNPRTGAPVVFPQVSLCGANFQTNKSPG